MSAIAIGKYFKVPGEKIKKALSNYIPTQNRSQYAYYKGAKVILDAYNANPSSMEAALKNLIAIKHQYKIAVLGDMFELGDAAPREHLKMAEIADNTAINLVVLIGNNFEVAARNKHWVHFISAKEAKPYFDALPFSNALILVKGSRGMKLESLLEN
jgi:UDP-N-acetylmuramoyl-tripeptide--D-alanyl-D-alanine ligase